MFFRSWYYSARYFAARFWGSVTEPVIPSEPEPIPPERLAFVDPEIRTFTVPVETRYFLVPIENRIVISPAETRTILVPDEDRISTGSE